MTKLPRITIREHAQLLLLHGHVVFDPAAQDVKPLIGPLMHWQHWDMHTPSSIKDRQSVLSTLRRPKCLLMVDDGAPELADQLYELRKNDPYIGIVLIEKEGSTPLDSVVKAAQGTGTEIAEANHWHEKNRSSHLLMQAMYNARELAAQAGLPREEPLKPVPGPTLVEPEQGTPIAAPRPHTISRATGKERIRPGAGWHQKSSSGSPSL